MAGFNAQTSQTMFATSAEQQHPLGTRREDKRFRVYRYVKAGAVDLIAGTLVQSPASIAGSNTLTVETTSSVAVGATSIKVTCGSSIAENFYAEGYAIIASGAGQGYEFNIANHAAVSTGANGQFYLNANDGEVLQTAITVTSTVTLTANMYRGVVIVPATTATGLVVGLAINIIPATYFGWVQTWGQCAWLGNAAFPMGCWVNGIAATCGRVIFMSAPAVTACHIVGQPIGRAYQTGVAGEWTAGMLMISP